MRLKNCGTFLNGVIIFVIFTINEYYVSVGCKQNYFPIVSEALLPIAIFNFNLIDTREW